MNSFIKHISFKERVPRLCWSSVININVSSVIYHIIVSAVVNVVPLSYNDISFENKSGVERHLVFEFAAI